MMTPKAAATMPPTNSANGKLTTVGNPEYMVNNAAEYAPTLMKPACPKTSWPKKPVAKFKLTAKITLMQTMVKMPE